VHLKGEYIGVLTFMDKPDGWVSKGKQMRYLWEVIARDAISNTEVFCQFTRANETLAGEWGYTESQILLSQVG